MEESKRYKAVLEAVERGEESANTELAWFLLSGCGGAEKNEEKAVELLEERKIKGDLDAMLMLVICYEFGIGVQQDSDEARTLYFNSQKKPFWDIFCFPVGHNDRKGDRNAAFG